MTTKTATLSAQSTSPFGSTLHDVRKHIVSRPDLAPQRRSNLLSAINKLCQILDRPDHQIPTAMNLLRPLLDNASPGAFLVNPRHWGNIRSSVFAGIKLSGLGGDFNAKVMPITDAWQGIVDRTAGNQQKCFMRRFGRFCSARQITPAAVDDSVIQSYRVYLDDVVSKQPDRCVDDLLRTWARLIDANSDLNLATLSTPNRSRAYCLPWVDLPDTLFKDTMAYKSAIMAPDPFANDARTKVRPATADQYERMIPRMATAALKGGATKDDISRLARLVSPCTLRRALTYFLERNNNHFNQQTHDMAHLALGIAKHWAHLPEEEIAEIKKLAKTCTIKRSGMTTKNRERLQQFRDEGVIVKLLNLPEQLFDQARKSAVNCRTAMMMQTAIALGILIAAPIRIANLRSLDRSRHFKGSFSTKLPVMQLSLAAEEVKNSVDLNFQLSPELMAMIDLYMKEYQPLLCGEIDSSTLFPGRGGQSKCDTVLRRQITDGIWDHMGIHVNPHLFRHLAGLLFLSKHPGSYEDVRRLLGHKSVQTTINFYAGLEATAAVDRYNDVVSSYRDVIKKKA